MKKGQLFYFKNQCNPYDRYYFGYTEITKICKGYERPSDMSANFIMGDARNLIVKTEDVVKI